MNIAQSTFLPHFFEDISKLGAPEPSPSTPLPPIQILTGPAPPAQPSNKRSSVSGPPRGPEIPSGRSTAHPSLVRVTAVRGRVLCTQCHGENDDNFIFCQWCATPQREDQAPDDECTLHIDEEALTTRLQQFQTFINSSSSAVRRDTTALAFEQFLASRKSSFSKKIQTVQPSDVIAFLCWLDTCGKRRRTVVHAMHCEAVGAASLAGCSTSPDSCNR